MNYIIRQSNNLHRRCKKVSLPKFLSKAPQEKRNFVNKKQMHKNGKIFRYRAKKRLKTIHLKLYNNCTVLW